VKGDGQRVVMRNEDMASLGCWQSGTSRGAEAHNGKIGGIGVQAG